MGYLSINTTDIVTIWRIVGSNAGPLIVAADWQCKQAVAEALKTIGDSRHRVVSLYELLRQSPVGTVFGGEIIPRLLAAPPPGIDVFTVEVLTDESLRVVDPPMALIHLRRVPGGWEKFE